MSRFELPPDTRLLASELVALADELSTDERTAMEEAVLDSLAAVSRGDTRTALTDDVAALRTAGKLSAIMGEPGDYKPLIVDQFGDETWLYHQRLHAYEVRLAALATERLATEPTRIDDAEAALAEVVALPPQMADGTAIVLNEGQQAAIEIAATRGLSIVTGGPGTGKTSIVVSLLRVLARLGIETNQIALAAPTGKAANRMGESIRSQLATLAEPSEGDLKLAKTVEDAVTLHRLLEYSPRGGMFRRDANNPLTQQWVIVDEASMIDLILMERLFQCVGPDAHLVLLGDAEQLPSVDTGAVLRDFIGTGETPPHVVVLTESYRVTRRDQSGAHILETADAIRRGDNDSVNAVISDAATTSALFEDGVRWQQTTEENERELVRNFVDAWFDRGFANPQLLREIARPLDVDGDILSAESDARVHALFTEYAARRVLCATRVFATGTQALNEMFHRRMVRATDADPGRPFCAGDPVLVTRNDYERGLFNGDQGIVLPVGDRDNLMVMFPASESSTSQYRPHHLTALSAQIVHAYAMTVHKSQGSEFDEVGIVLPPEDVPILTREILYTAVTRARRRVSILGRPEIMATAVDRQTERSSGLAERIGG